MVVGAEEPDTNARMKAGLMMMKEEHEGGRTGGREIGMGFVDKLNAQTGIDLVVALTFDGRPLGQGRRSGVGSDAASLR